MFSRGKGDTQSGRKATKHLRMIPALRLSEPSAWQKVTGVIAVEEDTIK